MQADKYTLYRIRVGMREGPPRDAQTQLKPYNAVQRIYTPPPHLGRQTSAAHASYHAHIRTRARGRDHGAAGLPIARAEVRGCSLGNERYAKIGRRPRAVQGGASRACDGAAPAKGVGMHAESTVGSRQVAGSHARGPKVRLDEVEWAVRGRAAEHAARAMGRPRGDGAHLEWSGSMPMKRCSLPCRRDTTVGSRSAAGSAVLAVRVNAAEINGEKD